MQAGKPYYTLTAQMIGLVREVKLLCRPLQGMQGSFVGTMTRRGARFLGRYGRCHFLLKGNGVRTKEAVFK